MNILDLMGAIQSQKRSKSTVERPPPPLPPLLPSLSRLKYVKSGRLDPKTLELAGARWVGSGAIVGVAGEERVHGGDQHSISLTWSVSSAPDFPHRHPEPEGRIEFINRPQHRIASTKQHPMSIGTK